MDILLDLFYMEIKRGSERISDFSKVEQLSLVHNSKISKNKQIYVLFSSLGIVTERNLKFLEHYESLVSSERLKCTEKKRGGKSSHMVKENLVFDWEFSCFHVVLKI